MKKELPKIYVNKIDKVLTNNKRVSYGFKEEEPSLEKRKEVNSIVQKSNMSVEEKITAIFDSPGYVYKASVLIKLKEGIVNKQIIGKNNTHLITIENELMPIKEIIDIDFSN